MRRLFRILVRTCVAIAVLLAIVGGLVYYVVTSGPVSNNQLRAQVESRFSSMLGPGLDARIENTELTFASGGLVSLQIRGVAIFRDGTVNLGVAERVLVKMKAWPLLFGDFVADEISVDGAKIAVAPLVPQLPALADETGFVFDWTAAVNIHDIMSALGRSVSGLSSAIEQAGLETVRFGEMQLVGFDQFGLRMKRARLEQLVFSRGGGPEDALSVNGRLISDYNTLSLEGEWARDAGEASVLDMALTGLTMKDILLSRDAVSSPFLQMDSPLTIRLQAPFDGEFEPDTATVSVAAGEGNFVLGDDIRTRLAKADMKFLLMPEKNQIELDPSPIKFAQTQAVLSGGIRFPKSADEDPLFELLANDVTAYSMNSAVEGANGALQISGSVNRKDKTIRAQKLLLKTPTGDMAGDATLDFSSLAANLRLDLKVASMAVSHFKQFWPAIIAPGAHEWADEGISGGQVRNAQLSMKLPVQDLWNDKDLTGDQLTASIPIEGATVKTTGALPPISDAMGEVGVSGSITSIRLSSGRLNTGPKQSVSLENGSLILQTGKDGSLPADLAMKLTGNASAIAQLGALEPLNFVDRLGLSPDGLSGSVSAGITTSFDVLKDFDPVANQWAASVVINNGASRNAFAGRKIADADLVIEASPASATIRGKARIDGLSATLDMIEPLSPGGNTQREITLSLDAAARKRLGIDTGGILKGTVGVRLSSAGDTDQVVEADLKSATLNLPWIGWTKGKGIPGSAQFILKRSGKTIRLDNFSLKGKGFSARGSIVVGQNGLTEAVMKKVRLNRTDDFDVNVKKTRKGFAVSIDARSYDGRGIIQGFLNSQQSATGGGQTVSVDARVGKLIGFNNTALQRVKLTYVQSGTRIQQAVVKAFADGKAATSFELRPVRGGMETVIYSENAGAVLGFLDIYAKLRGGTLEAKLVRDKSRIFRGTVEAKNFTLLDEPRLAALLRPPANNVQREDRLQREIRKLPAFRNSSARVETLRADIEKGTGFLKIGRGRMQGGDASAAFEGTVYDTRNRMNIRGTFLPGRGLNRLVSNIPLLGLAFGSGKTTGLLGITFRLRGPYGNPQIAVNPLSIIAPGVFRRLFQF